MWFFRKKMKTFDGTKIVPGLRVRITTPGHECESNVGNPAVDSASQCVRVAMHQGYKLMRPDELVAVMRKEPK